MAEAAIIWSGRPWERVIVGGPVQPHVCRLLGPSSRLAVGIGQAIATGLPAAGADVVLADVDGSG